MTAATVCAICSAVYPARDPHTCTYENPHQEGTPTMANHHRRRPPPGPAGESSARVDRDGIYIEKWPTPDDAERHVRLDCLRLAAETGLPVDRIQQQAAEWADFVLGTTKKEN